MRTYLKNALAPDGTVLNLSKVLTTTGELKLKMI
jgi:hypothetical protein